MIQSTALVGLFFLLDQASKIWASKALAFASRDLVFFSLTLVHNRGAAFGLGQNLGPVILLLSAIFIVIGFLILCFRPTTGLGRWGLMLLLAGAGGNLCDRVRVGAVIDFIDFRFFPVFNLADTWITFGTIFIAIAIWQFEQKGGY